MAVEAWKSLLHMHMCGTSVLDMGMQTCICVSFMPSNPSDCELYERFFFENWQNNTIQRTLIIWAKLIEIRIRAYIHFESQKIPLANQHNQKITPHIRTQFSGQFDEKVQFISFGLNESFACMLNVLCALVLQRTVKIHFIRIEVV